MDDMFAPVVLEPAIDAGSAITAIETNPVLAFTDKAKQERFFHDIEREVAEFVADASTPKGRDAIRSIAFKVVKCKTGIDKAGLKLTEDARAQIDAVNAARRDIKDRLEALAEKAREPLTKWEAAEEKRKAAVAAFFRDIDHFAMVTTADTSVDIANKLLELEEMALEVSPDVLLERLDEARHAVEKAASYLKTEMARTQKAEDDARELERLRAAEALRVAEEAAKAEAEAERQRVEREAADAKARAEADAKAEADLIEAVKREDAKSAAREADERARAEQAVKDREYEAQLAEANRRADEERQRAADAEAARKAEADRIAAEKAAQDRAAELQRLADEKRQADQAHRGAVMKAAKEALIQHADIAEDVAKRVVLAITGGNIPAVAITF